MARVPYLTPADLSPEHARLLDRPITLFRGLANSPGALANHHQFGEWIRWDCTLDPRLRELLILQVGYLTKSPYEFSHHIEISQSFGVTEADIRQLISLAKGEPTTLEATDVLTLNAARELTEDGGISDSTWAALAQHFDNTLLTEFVIVVSFYNYVVRVLSALQIDVEPEYQKYLDQFPLS